MRLLLFLVGIIAVDLIWGRRLNRKLPGPPAPEWKQWLVFFFALASVYLTFFAARGGFEKKIDAERLNEDLPRPTFFTSENWRDADVAGREALPAVDRNHKRK